MSQSVGVANNRDMCLIFSDYPTWNGINVIFMDAQYALDQECRGSCMPCESGSCQISGFYIPKFASMSPGYLVDKLQYLDSKDVLMNNKYNLPE
jgi:hypothetical protein